jgi:hypothetical protein
MKLIHMSHGVHSLLKEMTVQEWVELIWMQLLQEMIYSDFMSQKKECWKNLNSYYQNKSSANRLRAYWSLLRGLKFTNM